MRHVTQICLALLGLALADGSLAWADDPHLCQACQARFQQQQQQPQQAQQQQSHRHGFRPARMCENCMKAQQANGGPLLAPPMMVANNAGCTTCQLQASNGVMNPGYRNAAAGYAMSGQPMQSTTEPMPIGVMQTSYSPAPGAPGYAPGHAMSGGALSPNDPAALTNGRYVNTLAPTPSRRPHILLHLIGLPTPEAVRERQLDKEKGAHASIPYGPNTSSVSELPASMVYGR
jgi:hypothetical protein